MRFRDMENDEPSTPATEEAQVETTEQVETSGEEPAEAQTEQTQDPQELLRALKEDRERDIARQIALEQQNEFYRNIAMQHVQKPQPPAQPPTSQHPSQQKFQPDDLIAYGDFQSELDARLTPLQQQFQQRLGQIDEELTKREYSDFDAVIDQLVIPMIRANPALMQEINAQPRPALYAYKLGCMTPEYVAYQRKTATEQVASKIEKNLQKPKTLGNQGTPQNKFVAGDIQKMSSKEFAEYRAKALGY